MVFSQPVNNCRLTVASPRSSGATSIVVTDASPLGTLPPGSFFRITAFRRHLSSATIDAQTVQLITETILTVLPITSVVGNTLTVGDPLEGLADSALVAGDLLEVRVTAGTLFEIYDAIVPFSQPFFTSFRLVPAGAFVASGATFSGGVTFEWTLANRTAVAANSISITDVTNSQVLATGLPDTGTATVTLPTSVTGTNGTTHTWRVKARDTQNNSVQFDWTVTWLTTSDKTYYVNNSTGNDSNNGTTAGTPFLTLQKAADVVAAGDTVNVANTGTSYVGFVVGWNAPQNGCAGHPITFAPAAGVIVNHKNPHTQDAIDIEACSYVTIQNFTVQNDGSYNRACIRASGGSYGTQILNNTVNGGGSALDRYGIFGGFASDALVQGNTVSNIGALGQGTGHGIYWSNSLCRATIRNNTVSTCPGDGIHLNGDVSQGGTGVASDCLIENNVIHNTNATYGGAGINPDGLVNSVIRNNLIYSVGSAGITLYQTDAASGSQDNIVVNNTVSVSSDSKWALNINTNSTGNTVFNNVFYNTGSDGAIVIDSTSLLNFNSDYNVCVNLFSQNAGDTTETLTSWRTGTGQDAHSVSVTSQSSLFIAPGDNLHAALSSPLIDAGTSTLNGKSAPTTDLDGLARPQGPSYDAGCYETDPLAPRVSATSPLPGAVAQANTVTVTFNKDVQSASIIFTLLDSAGVAVAGSGVYNSGTHVYTFTPTSAPLTTGIYSASVSGVTISSGSVEPGAYNWMFLADSTGIMETLFGVTEPATSDFADSSAYTFGVRFKPTADGHVSGVRFYKSSSNTGTHTAFLWATDQTTGAFSSTLATKSFSTESARGWQNVLFDAEVAVTSGTKYKVGVFMPKGHYSYDNHYFVSDVSNGSHLTAFANNDATALLRNDTFVASSTAAFPTTGVSGAANNYWVDVIYHLG